MEFFFHITSDWHCLGRQSSKFDLNPFPNFDIDLNIHALKAILSTAMYSFSELKRVIYIVCEVHLLHGI